jgi:hypothetical protein
MLLACLILAGASPARALQAHAAAEHRIVQGLHQQASPATSEWAAKLLVVVHHYAAVTIAAEPTRPEHPEARSTVQALAASARTALTPGHIFGTGAQAAP